MIVLGPRDADLGGAPDYWREGNWRPDTLERGPHTCSFTSIPFDKCDEVFEYDARRPKQPMPSDQGWEFQSEGSSEMWQYDPLHGVLRFQADGKAPSFWQREGNRDGLFDRAAAYGLFLVGRPADKPRQGGLNFLFQAPPDEGHMHGMRGVYSSFWHWRALDSTDILPIIHRAAEPEIEQVWHRFGMDAELVGAKIEQDNIDSNDGGKTIGSLDGLISNEDRHFFGYPDRRNPVPMALFGMTDPSTTLSGMVRNYVASFPGRFLRPAFRSTALSEITRLRLVFCRAASEDDRPAVFAVRYTAPSLGMRDNTLPNIDAPRELVKFDPGRPGDLVEISVPLERLRPGEPILFTMERDWRSDDDQMRDTVHLLSVILEPVER